LPYNINILTQLTAKFALDHQAFLQQQTAVLRAERASLLAALNALTDIQAYPSQANFIMFRCLNIRADTVFDSLKQQGILIKNLSRQGGLLTDCLRVTVGTPEENLSFLKALQLALQPAS
jgi:histidinol-phosphate aminotransferase